MIALEWGSGRPPPTEETSVAKDAPLEKPHVITLDQRRRVCLGRFAGRHECYLVTEYPDGTLVFRPAVVVPASSDPPLEQEPPA
jgi:hypothetical protein